jgi:photosystem II stability/assembly factor-like uncharacterized protein
MVRTTIILALLAFLACGLAFTVPAGAATEAEIDAAIAKGVNYLVPLQSTGGAPSGAWPGDGFYAANTGFAVTALEHDAERLGKSPLDPSYAHAANVQNGLNYLFSSATYDAANHWVYWNVGGNNAYQTGPCLMAISRSGAPGATVSVGPLIGVTYRQVAQMAVDWLASAQIKTGTGNGAWGYNKGDTKGDQSATGWATMGLGYAENSTTSSTLPADLLTRLSTWNDEIQSHDPGPTFGGAGYNVAGPFYYNIYKTGHLLYMQGLVGDTIGAQRVQNALTFMTVHWLDPNNGDYSAGTYGWRGNPPSIPPSYIATLTATKGFGELSIDTFNGINWYNDFSNVIVANQLADGHWLGSSIGEMPLRSTCWALMTLLRATSHVPPTITGFTPGSGPVGSTVIITGTSLNGASVVTFNGTPATDIHVDSATQITVTVPAGATTGRIGVTTPGGTITSATNFTVAGAPVGWFTQNSGSTADLEGVACSGSSRAWAVGGLYNAGTDTYSGAILGTANGGVAWSPQTPGTTEYLLSVAFPNASLGWAVGWNGAVTATTNSGGTWSPQVAGSTEYLTAVAFSDATHGWAVGYGGVILSTANGGGTWSAQTSGTGEDLYGVAFSDGSHGWAVGSGGVLATTNGGATWQAQGSVGGSGLLGVAFPDDLHGWIVGSGGTILVTNNGGFPAAPTAKPLIARSEPASGKRGALVSLTGANFGATQGAGAVKFGSRTCTTYLSWSDRQITCKVPRKAKVGKLKVTVTTTAGKSNAKSFKVKR